MDRKPRRAAYREPKRAVIRVKLIEPKSWGIAVNEALVDVSISKRGAVECARELANLRSAWNLRSQIVVHAATGKIQTEWTYPDDTPRRKG